MYIGPRPDNAPTYVPGLGSTTAPQVQAPLGDKPAAAAHEAAVVQALKGLVQTTNLIAMSLRVDQAKNFEARNKVFHEYFDKQKSQEDKLPYFATFMQVIPKDEGARVMKFLEGLGEKDAAKKK